MTQPIRPDTNPHVTVEGILNIRVQQWMDETAAVVFNPASGNTFEVDLYATRLIQNLNASPNTISEAIAISGIEYPGLDQKVREFRFRKEYLEPLNQLDLIRLISK